MLELKNVSRSYTTAGFTQVALDDVSVTFRDNEFVAILGPSGSGKTTMLNILGGLDHADSGDIVINGVSTKDYSDKDWDTYRNHRIGFIFQSYNLIPHQSILSNVELALTLSGVSGAERTRRARRALEQVGLAEHANKRPNQLSGGQMQRVAIARALVNDPDIVLADEPTGALDTDTGIQIMDLLKEVANDRLVVMVTHNPELAEEYATRIVSVRDGHIVGDTRPIGPQELGAVTDVRSASKSGKASMSPLTALALSFNNLMTKKGRTFLTAFAGSIGIIGIAAILALSNGVNDYIARTEEEALSSYPLTITKSSFDLTSLLGYSMGSTTSSSGESEETSGDSIRQVSIMTDMFAEVKTNDLRAFREFLQSGESGIDPFVNTIQYTYSVTPQIFKSDTSDGVVQLNPSSLMSRLSSGVMGSALTGTSSSSSFTELLDDRDILDTQMEVVRGRWPEAYDECVLVLNSDGSISDYTLYALGFYDTDTMNEMADQALAGEEVTAAVDEQDFTYDDALSMTFSVVPASSMYQYNSESGTWTDMSSDDEFMANAIANGIELRVVGVVQASEDSSSALMTEGVAYSPLLTQRLIELAEESTIVQQQMADPDVDVFTGETFESLQDDQDSEFDLSNIFTVDEDALTNAFSMDTSSMDLSSLGSMDLSGVSLDTSSMDLSGIDLDTSALADVFSAENIAAALSGVPAYDASELELDLTDEQQAELIQAASSLQQGFTTWLMTEKGVSLEDLQDADVLASYWDEYAATDDAQAQLSILTDFGEDVQSSVQASLESYVTEDVLPVVASNMQALVQTAAQAMATQLASQLADQMASVTGQLGTRLSEAISGQLQSQMTTLMSSLSNGFSFDADAFSNAIQFNMTQEDLTSLLYNYMNASELTYDANLETLGWADLDDPASISIYPKDFDAKESVLAIIDQYNDDQVAAGNEDGQIQYTDITGTLMSSVTSIVNMISLVLIAFVSISLVVSSIMIAIITYISVLERKKEIGILRAMGASKLNVANVFNAETIIEGFISGVLAIAVVLAAEVPVNAYIFQTRGVSNIMQLSASNAAILIAISVILTMVAGLIPASLAARRDPVEALRSE